MSRVRFVKLTNALADSFQELVAAGEKPSRLKAVYENCYPKKIRSAVFVKLLMRGIHV